MDDERPLTPAPDSEWIDANYYVDPLSGSLRCRRCDRVVDWLTKHAAERHGDPIAVMPVAPSKVGVDWLW